MNSGGWDYPDAESKNLQRKKNLIEQYNSQTVKIIERILANWIQQDIKRTIYCEFQGPYSLSLKTDLGGGETYWSL